jgi:hypothetical protein
VSVFLQIVGLVDWRERVRDRVAFSRLCNISSPAMAETAGLDDNFTCLSNTSLVRRDCRVGGASFRGQGASSPKRDLLPPTSYVRASGKLRAG